MGLGLGCNHYTLIEKTVLSTLRLGPPPSGAHFEMVHGNPFEDLKKFCITFFLLLVETADRK